MVIWWKPRNLLLFYCLFVIYHSVVWMAMGERFISQRSCKTRENTFKSPNVCPSSHFRKPPNGLDWSLWQPILAFCLTPLHSTMEPFKGYGYIFDFFFFFKVIPTNVGTKVCFFLLKISIGIKDCQDSGITWSPNPTLNVFLKTHALVK